MSSENAGGRANAAPPVSSPTFVCRQRRSERCAWRLGRGWRRGAEESGAGEGVLPRGRQWANGQIAFPRNRDVSCNSNYAAPSTHYDCLINEYTVSHQGIDMQRYLETPLDSTKWLLSQPSLIPLGTRYGRPTNHSMDQIRH